MNNYLKQLVVITLFTSLQFTHADPFNKRDTYGKPFFAGRSQGDNLARRLVGEVNELVPCCPGMNGIISVTAEWSETFHSKALGQYFSFRMPQADNCRCENDFVRTDSSTMRFRGGLATDPDFNPANTDVRAENFLLASTFSGLIKLRPKVENFIVDINWRMNLDGITSGLYVEVGVPVVWTRWRMGLRQLSADQTGNITINAASNPTAEPAPEIQPYNAVAPITNIIDAWRGESVGPLNFISTNGMSPIVIALDPMEFAKINGEQKKHGIADVCFVLGRNFACSDEGHLGVNLRVTAPVGTKPKGEFVFEPIIGNGHHLAVGAGMEGHVELWHDECSCRSMNLWFDSAIYHLFNAKQIRTFDLRENGVGSRYLLFKEFNAAGNFTNRFVPGPNVTTLPAKVSIKVMGELVILFDYQWSGVTFDIGYNIWGRSRESITITGTIPTNTYGVLGAAPIDSSLPGAANQTNSQAQINGLNSSIVGDGANPIFVRTTDLDPKAAEAPSALSNKIFAHLGFTLDCGYVAPFFGIGAEAEFSGIRNNAFDQWGVWGKVGFAFS